MASKGVAAILRSLTNPRPPTARGGVNLSKGERTGQRREILRQSLNNDIVTNAGLVVHRQSLIFL